MMTEAWTQLLALTPEPGQEIDWTSLQATLLSPYFHKMSGTPQQTEWHGEGDVWTHTKMVCEQLVRLDGYRKVSLRQRQELFIAALLHDIAKPNTTRLMDGRLTAPRHGPVGAQMVRKLLWQEYDLAGTVEAQQMRETICLLIRYHTMPANAMKKDDPERYLRRIAANGLLVPDFNIRMLCLLAMADVKGRIATDTRELSDMVQLCTEQAEESGCLNRSYAFPDAHTAHAYFSGRNIQPGTSLFDDTWGEVTMLCALPGTGKDTWIGKHCVNQPVLSLDAIRREYRIKPTDDQGQVIQEGRQRARTMLASHQPFVFNGTNVTDMMRSKWIQLFENYHARVRIVYLETGWQENLRRNAARTESVPETVIDGLLEKMTPPEPIEAQTVEWKTV